MAKYDRKKLLKEPDEFISFSQKAIIWGRANLRLLLAVTGSVVAVVALAVGISSYATYRQIQAAKAFAPLASTYFQSRQTDTKVDTATLGKDLAALAESYGATPAGMQARLLLGSIHYQDGQFDQAQHVFQELSQDTDLPDTLAPLAWHGLGMSQEAAGQAAAAVESYAEAIRLAGPNEAHLFRLDQAHAMEAAGQKEKALATYIEVLESPFGQDGLSILAQARLAALGGRMPAPKVETAVQ